ncbi:PorP/SprF family type IX secretion system membrane protein [Spongiivirga citrea]|uniref:Type IX secretion system membrane protein PorP/SprF n=1 Tax=Spongiivirga citrea TaxID=1481457 RepID=A0A6M0CL01_9FLAO|nr:type IX secretion system membrane protein PorP/SprF [Spongiivirga citrea]NER18332.1 type IX secretion system membrane protein PorP/SprF [Spongiivirga citrea]
MKELRYISLLVLLLVGLPGTTIAQQDPSYTLYNYNMNVINPAFAGSTEQTQLNVNFRSQWVGLQGAPETQSLSLGIPINNKIGIGASVVNDRVFVLNETDAYIDFSYKLQLTDNTKLYLGLKAGGSFVDIDLNSLQITNDPLFTENVSTFNPNIGIGALLRTNNYYITLSAPQLLKSDRYEKEAGIATEATDELHFFAGGGYHISLNDNLQFTPSTMVRMVSGSPTTIDLTGTFDIYNRIELGLNYRLNESVSGLAFVKMADWMAFGYAYDRATTNIGDYSRGSHEVLLRFNL